jgi:hypothetical protein
MMNNNFLFSVLLKKKCNIFVFTEWKYLCRVYHLFPGRGGLSLSFVQQLVTYRKDDIFLSFFLIELYSQLCWGQDLWKELSSVVTINSTIDLMFSRCLCVWKFEGSLPLSKKLVSATSAQRYGWFISWGACCKKLANTDSAKPKYLIADIGWPYCTK